jgi:hypothetical protein
MFPDDESAGGSDRTQQLTGCNSSNFRQYEQRYLMARKTAKKQFPARRKFNLRRDATVATGQREIERVFGLPEGSVRLHLPSGRPARADKSIDALLDGYARR